MFPVRQMSKTHQQNATFPDTIAVCLDEETSVVSDAFLDRFKSLLITVSVLLLLWLCSVVNLFLQ